LIYSFLTVFQILKIIAMKKHLFFLIFCLVCIRINAQNPKGFNYQAIARNGSGTPLANQNLQVRLTLQADSIGNTVIWKELHSNVMTNSFGLLNIVVGRGSRISGNALKFDSIDWTITPMFIRTEINDGTWKEMGTTRLWSVPFSMVSSGLASGSKLIITGNDDASNDALFEVKRKDGQTVFAVYNDKVNVYVPDQSSKRAKGGFAVGGYDNSKGFSQQYLSVTPDSIRFYIDDLQGKGSSSKGGFAVGGFDQTKGAPQKYLSILGASTVDTITAKGSIALGMFSRALADFSTSLGYHSTAIQPFSTAIGYYAFASGSDSYAIGSHAEANGPNSIAIGSFGLTEDGKRDTSRATWTPGYYSLAFGMGAQATHVGAMSLGVNTTASGDQSVAIGFGTSAGSQFATAMGYKANAKGFKSIAIGAHYNVTFDKPVWEWSTTLGKWVITNVPTPLNKETSAEGDYSIAIGNGNYSNNGGMSLGTNNRATTYGSVAIGHSNEAAGDFSFVAGFSNYANGLKSFAFGDNLNARSANSFIIGTFNKIEGTVNEWFDKEPLFVIGNGNPVTRSNAFAVLKDGNIVLSPNIMTGAGLQLYYDPGDGLIKKQVSSLKYKTVIEPVENIGWLYNLKPVSFYYNADPSKKTNYGLIAEDMESVNRDLVIYLDGKPEGINYDGLFAPMIRALQDQKTMIDDLNTRNSILSGENEELKARLDRLEKIVGDLAAQDDQN
jgi:hypothetical protein